MSTFTAVVRDHYGCVLSLGTARAARPDAMRAAWRHIRAYARSWRGYTVTIQLGRRTILAESVCAAQAVPERRVKAAAGG